MATVNSALKSEGMTEPETKGRAAARGIPTEQEPPVVVFSWSEFAASGHPNLTGWREHEHEAESRNHLHRDFYALRLVTRGNAIGVFNGHAFSLVRGDIFFLPSGVTQSHVRGNRFGVDVFYFRPAIFRAEERALLRGYPGLGSLFLGLRGGRTASDFCLRLPSEQFERALNLGAEIRGELAKAKAGDALASHLARQAFFRLVAELVRWNHELHPLEPDTRLTGAESGLAELLRFCDEHFRERISVPEMASRLFVSPGHFHELFKRELGVSPAAYLRRLRLSEAQTLLRNSEQSLGGIARDCGFRDVAELSRAFSRSLGMSPREYRRQFQEVEVEDA